MSRNAAIVLGVAVVAAIGIAGLALYTTTMDVDPTLSLNPQDQHQNGTTPAIPSTGGQLTGSVLPSSAPVVDTTSAGSLTRTTATLNGQVNPNGGTSAYWFEYGTDPSLTVLMGNTTPTELSASGANMSASANVIGLNPNTRYYYRVVAQNSAGTAQGDIVEFRTGQ